MDDYSAYRVKRAKAADKKRRQQGKPPEPTPPATPERPWIKNLIVIGGNAAQCKTRQRELIDQLGDQVSGNWTLLSTADRSGAARKLAGVRLNKGDLIDFYGTWEDGVSAEAILRDLRIAGWSGDRISEVVRERNARIFEKAKAEALELAREIHSPPDA